MEFRREEKKEQNAPKIEQNVVNRRKEKEKRKTKGFLEDWEEKKRKREGQTE